MKWSRIPATTAERLSNASTSGRIPVLQLERTGKEGTEVEKIAPRRLYVTIERKASIPIIFVVLLRITIVSCRVEHQRNRSIHVHMQTEYHVDDQ